MVQKVAGTPITPDGVVSLQWLAEGRDGVYRPTAGVYQEKVRCAFPSQSQNRSSKIAITLLSNSCWRQQPQPLGPSIGM